MDHDLETKYPLPFGYKRNRLAEYLAADVFVAAGSATLITPAVMIFDRLVAIIVPLSILSIR